MMVPDQNSANHFNICMHYRGQAVERTRIMKMVSVSSRSGHSEAIDLTCA